MTSKNYNKAIYFTNECDIRPIIADDNLESGYFVDRDSYIYTKENDKFYPYKVRKDKDGRTYTNISLNHQNKRCYPAYRLAKISFGPNPKPYSYYKDLEADHVNPSKPLNNSIDNIEFVSPKENMWRAGDTGVMIKKYKKDLVHQLCQMICDGIPRYEIKERLGVNGQLVDDIRSGRSHRSVSCQYLDKGFEYKKFDREEKEKIVREVCEYIDQGYRNFEIDNLLGDRLPNNCFVSDIRCGYCYRNISKEYNFSKNMNRN